MKIKLRRDWQGQDSYGAFAEEVAIDPKTFKLAYRMSTGGNCNYGAWKDWQDEADALRFMLGPIKVTLALRTELFVALSNLPDLRELTSQEMADGDSDKNYGVY
jgi:hypothetical protein